MGAEGSDHPGVDRSDALARAEAAVARLTEESRDLERRLVATEDRLADFRAQANTDRDKLRRLRERRAVRLADRLDRWIRRVRRVRRRVTGGGSAGRPSDATDDDGLPADGLPLASRGRPAAFRAALAPRLAGKGARLRLAWADAPIEAASRLGDVVAITATPPPDLVLASDPGTQPERLPLASIRVLIPDGPVDAAVAAAWDVVVPRDRADPDPLPDAIRDAVTRWLAATRVGLRIATKTADVAEGWGDTFVARDLRRAFADAGWPARIHYRDAWDDPAVGRSDVVIDIVGLRAPAELAGRHRLLWLISHPERATTDLLDRYDHVFVASTGFSEVCRSMTSAPVTPLPQATDPRRFTPREPGTPPDHDLVVVANWRRGRRIPADLLPTDHDLAVYGRDWTPERLDPRHLVAEHADNATLGAIYAGAALVLNDHWAGMRREGFISNRIYDATAAGALVISDDVIGLDDAFDGAIPAYRDAAHLRELVDAFLADPAAREERVRVARAAVLDRHTFAHRVAVLQAVVAEPGGPGSEGPRATLPRDVRDE